MLTFGARAAFHARVDLPPTPRALAEVVDLLLEPAVRHGVDRVLLVLYTADAAPRRAGCRARSAAFERRRIEVRRRAAADGRRWLPLRARRPVTPGCPTTCRRTRSRPRRSSTGRVTHGSRAELAATLASPTRARSRRSTAALATRSDRGQPAAEAGWARRRCAAAWPTGGPLDDETARLLAADARPRRPRRGLGDADPRRRASRHVALLDRRGAARARRLVAGAAAVLALRRLAVRARCPRVVRGRPLPRGRPRPLAGRAGGRPAGRRRCRRRPGTRCPTGRTLGSPPERR